MLFKDVVGQSELKNQLIKDVQNNAISHAYIFAGNLGYGGFPLALSFAQYINCENPLDTDSCGVCSNCKQMNVLQHPDLHFSFPSVSIKSNNPNICAPFLAEFYEKVLANPYLTYFDWMVQVSQSQLVKSKSQEIKQGNISVDEGARISNALSLKSFSGGYKISIIWLAEYMHTATANKLLKILEEPPEKTIFLLITEKLSILLPTIISRARIKRCSPIDKTSLMNWASEHDFNQLEVVESAWGRSEGDFIHFQSVLTNETDNQTDCENFIQLMRACYKKEVIPMLDWASSIGSAKKEEQKNFLLYCLHMVRQCVLINYSGGTISNVSKEEGAFLSKFSKFISGNNVLSFYKLFNSAHYALVRNGNSKILFTNLTFEVMRYIHRA